MQDSETLIRLATQIRVTHMAQASDQFSRTKAGDAARLFKAKAASLGLTAFQAVVPAFIPGASPSITQHCTAPAAMSVISQIRLCHYLSCDVTAFSRVP